MLAFLSRKLVALTILLILFASFFMVREVFAGSVQYFSGDRTFGQLAISNNTNLTGGKTITTGCFGAYRSHTATQITPFHKIEAVSGGCYVQLNHSTQFNKQSHCWWSAESWIPGTLNVTCYYFHN